MNPALRTASNVGHVEAYRSVSAVTPFEVLSWNPAGTTADELVTTAANAAITISSLADVAGTSASPGSPPASDPTNGIFTFPRREGTLAQFRFFGTGADNATGIAYIYGWDMLGCGMSTLDQKVQWTPVYLHTLTFTLSAKVGIANGILGANIRYADTINVTRQGSLPPNQGRVIGLAAGGDEGIADFGTDALGFQFLTVMLNRNGSATRVGFAHRML